MGIENNGYLDPTQTIINYVIREKGGTFEDLQVHDPNQMLANWRKVRRSAQGTSLACAIAGGLGGFVGVFTMAIPLGVAGISIAILGGYLFKHHGDGAKATQTESDILDRCRTVLTLFLELQRRGADPNVLAGLYDRLIKAAIANRLDVGEPAALKAFFEREIEQSNVVAVLLGKEQGFGIASTQMPAPKQQQQQQLQLGSNTPETQPIGASTRLGAVASTAVAVEDRLIDDWLDGSTVAINTQPGQDDGDTTDDQEDWRYDWAKDLLHFPAVLIYGAQGSGKTSFTAWLLRERIKAGHTAEVWDVHRRLGQWNGLIVHGDGMDYAAIDAQMGAFRQQVKADYRKGATTANYSPSPHTAVCEEFTNFARRCENSGEFFEESLSDFRKVNKCVIFVSHGRTLVKLGGSSGTAEMREEGLLELHLEAKIDPVTRKPVSARKGKLKLPGKAAISVDIAEWMQGAVDFSDIAEAASPAIPERAAENRNNAPSPVEEESHSASSELGLQANEVIKKIGSKVTEKIKAASGGWISIAALTRDLFNNSDDRTTAKELIDRAVINGTLESEERENLNKTTTVFVRVSRSILL
jgi:hypothetical protein